jgi:MFS family permease
MKKWGLVTILALAQFIMVLDSTVMNVSISTVVKDLNTTAAMLQTAITLYTLTMASFMLIGGKLGDIYGKRKIFIVGAMIYALGSFITAISPNVWVLILGWSLVEGLGAVLVIPAIAALIASNYHGKDRIAAFAIIGGISGVSATAGPLIGGYVTTYLSWRYVFIAEVVIMLGVLLFKRLLVDKSVAKKSKIDILSATYSVAGLMLLVFGILQSKVWGWVQPMAKPEIAGHEIAPLGISLVFYLIIIGIILLKMFYNRQQKLLAKAKDPLLDVSMLSSKQLRSGLGVLMAQYIITAAVFFVIPVYLQMTLGYDALETGLKILPLSISLILFSVIGTRLINRWTAKRIVRVGQVLLIVSSIALLGSISTDLKSTIFAVGMFLLGAGLGLLASQIGNVNMSAVPNDKSSEVGGLQGVFQNLGASLGTALIGSIMIMSLTNTFVSGINNSSLPNEIKTTVNQNSQVGVAIAPVNEVTGLAESKGATPAQAQEIQDIYGQSQLSSLKNSLTAVALVATFTLLFSRNIPNKKIKS